MCGYVRSHYTPELVCLDHKTKLAHLYNKTKLVSLYHKTSLPVKQNLTSFPLPQNLLTGCKTPGYLPPNLFACKTELN